MNCNSVAIKMALASASPRSRSARMKLSRERQAASLWTIAAGLRCQRVAQNQSLRDGSPASCTGTNSSSL